jgi:hypothetical protein
MDSQAQNIIVNAVVQIERDVPHGRYHDFQRDAAHSAHMQTDWVRWSIPKSTLLIENGKYDIKRYISTRR